MACELSRPNFLELSASNAEEDRHRLRGPRKSSFKFPILLGATALVMVSLTAVSSISKGSIFLKRRVSDGESSGVVEPRRASDEVKSASATNATAVAGLWELEPVRKDSIPEEVAVEELGIFELKSRLSQSGPSSPEASATAAASGWGNITSQMAGLALQTLQAQSSTSASCGVREYSGRQWGSDLCFCELAGNPACQAAQCVCPQGCGSHVTWDHDTTVTFANKARAEGCSPSTVLLTAPKAYFATPWDLARAGSECATEVVKTLLLDSWDTYQREVGKGSIWQCFHNSQIATVRYLHLQTFCEGGSFHAMPSNNQDVAHCVKMDSLDHFHVEALTKDLVRMIR